MHLISLCSSSFWAVIWNRQCRSALARWESVNMVVILRGRHQGRSLLGSVRKLKGRRLSGSQSSSSSYAKVALGDMNNQLDQFLRRASMHLLNGRIQIRNNRTCFLIDRSGAFYTSPVGWGTCEVAQSESQSKSQGYENCSVSNTGMYVNYWETLFTNVW